MRLRRKGCWRRRPGSQINELSYIAGSPRHTILCMSSPRKVSSFKYVAQLQDRDVTDVGGGAKEKEKHGVRKGGLIGGGD